MNRVQPDGEHRNNWHNASMLRVAALCQFFEVTRFAFRPSSVARSALTLMFLR